MAKNDFNDGAASGDAASDAGVQASLGEQLVAYLDGEMTPDEGRRIEALLASDPEARRQLQLLERTWDLLDELDAAPVGEPFTHTTLEMVAVAAREDVERDRIEAPRRHRRQFGIFAAAFLVSMLVGFAVVVSIVPDPNRRLLEDLPVLENLDEYRQVGSVGFLEKLRQENLFPGDDDGRGKSVVSASAPVRVGPTRSQRRERVESMTADERDELKRREDRFANLPPTAQQQLRQLHEELRRSPDAELLQAVMHRYCEWLRTLSSYRRSELTELGEDERVEWVRRRLREEHNRAGGKRPSEKDVETVVNWARALVVRGEAVFLETLPERQRGMLKERAPAQRRGIILQLWLADAAGRLPAMVTEADLAELRRQLSPDAQKQLESLSPPQQWRQVVAWIRARTRHVGGSRGHGLLLRADDERLADFFETGLTEEQRDRLLGLSGEEMQRELQRLFWTRVRMQEGRDHRDEELDFGTNKQDGSARPKSPGGNQQKENAPKRGREKSPPT